MPKSIDIDYLYKIGAIIKLQGREYVQYSGLLRIAHDNGLEAIEPTLISWDPETRSAIFKATVTGTRGTYTAHGDANPGNVSKNISTATLRMAETRAISRALRSYIGIGMTAVDELPGTSGDEEPAPPPAPRREPPIPEPVGTPEPRTEHDPSWAADRKKFCAALGHLTLRYEDVAAHCEANGRPRPSQMTVPEREGLYKWLRYQEGAEQVRAWSKQQSGEQAAS